MKAIVQRVTRASVTVGGEQISSIGRGICVLLGLSVEDTQKELEHMVRKILNLRVFEDESGKHWSKSVMDKQYEVLCVSQFTLQCVLKGNKPDYHMAMPTDQAESFYNSFLEQLRKTYKSELIKDGKFGAHMQVHIQNDGPVTIELESPAAPIDSKQRCQGLNLRPSACQADVLLLSHSPSLPCGQGSFSWQNLRSSNRGKRRPERRCPLSLAEREMSLRVKTTPVPAAEQRGTCLRKGNHSGSKAGSGKSFVTSCW
ncbi:D-aminoacyl-tRNA deacylase 1 isoform X2 [Paroedura picta]|uniref:D-aminoacyl-tRNA deacylase 1 isoform X2 n=1 Tax=Paroedura picta TaxID=143630 RepID=UPI004056AD1F